MTKQFYTPSEVARMLEVSDGTVRHWIRQGIIEGIKVGNPSKPRIRIQKDVVVSLLKQYGLDPIEE